jgi:hypothetical protein
MLVITAIYVKDIGQRRDLEEGLRLSIYLLYVPVLLNREELERQFMISVRRGRLGSKYHGKSGKCRLHRLPFSVRCECCAQAVSLPTWVDSSQYLNGTLRDDQLSPKPPISMYFHGYISHTSKPVTSLCDMAAQHVGHV